MKNLKKKCEMFCTTNDTGKWALCVDDYIGLYESEEAVSEALRPTADDHWDDSGYGSMQVLPPHTVAKMVDYDQPGNPVVENTQCHISDVQPIDMTRYIKYHADRKYQKFEDENKSDLRERFRLYLIDKYDYDNYEFFFDNEKMATLNNRLNKIFMTLGYEQIENLWN